MCKKSLLVWVGWGARCAVLAGFLDASQLDVKQPVAVARRASLVAMRRVEMFWQLETVAPQPRP